MINQLRPALAEGWLTPLQAALLTNFFATDTGQLFFLTGGTALAAYHLHHRLSVDLDLFTLDDLALRETDVLIPQLAADLECRIGRARRTEHFRQFLLEPEAGESLQIDLVRDFGPQYGEHIKVGDIVVDSLENIGVNKLTAILGRTEPKDVEEDFPRRSVLHPTRRVRFRRSVGEGSREGPWLATFSICAVNLRLRGAKVPALRGRSPFGAGSSPQGFVLSAQSFSSGQLVAQARA
jgi:hypothetical protein